MHKKLLIQIASVLVLLAASSLLIFSGLPFLHSAIITLTIPGTITLAFCVGVIVGAVLTFATHEAAERNVKKMKDDY